MRLLGQSTRDIEAAADLLRGGGLVGFPTETVYGLGANAADREAVARIFAAKGRPADHPLIVHVAAIPEIERWGREIPAVAWELAARFWPGPLTLILKRAPAVPSVVTGGQDTVGLRVPAHPLALQLLGAAGVGIAAPSANRFGRVSPTTAKHVLDELGEAVDCIVDGGPCSVGLESTIVDLSAARPCILRPGAVTAEALAEVLGELPGRAGQGAPRAPGSTPAHYAPSVPVRLLERSALQSAIAAAMPLAAGALAVLALRAPPAEVPGCRWLTMPGDPAAYGRVLYARLREADAPDCRWILIEQPPCSPSWEAVRDRLGRAAFGSVSARRARRAHGVGGRSDSEVT